MAFAVRKLGNDPIIIVSMEFPIERYLSSLHSTCAQIDQIATRAGQPLYRVMDMRSPDLSISDILLWIEEQHLISRGSINDPRLTPIMVGTHPLLPIWTRKVKQVFNVEIPIFSTLDAALAYVREKISVHAYPRQVRSRMN